MMCDVKLPRRSIPELAMSCMFYQFYLIGLTGFTSLFFCTLLCMYVVSNFVFVLFLL